MASDPISSDTKELEKALRGLDPTALDQDFLARLEAAADDQLIILSAEELRFGKELSGRAPAALSADFMLRMEKIVADVPFPVNEKIVLFPKTAPVRSAPRKGNRPMWAAAAAVALIGGATALLMPDRIPAPSGRIAQQSPPDPVRSSISQPSSNYTPYIMNTGFSDAKDEGVAWHQSGTPHRVLKLTYIDKVTLRNTEGKTVVVEQPRTEYIFVPEKMD
ncbi:hypothetical protein OVA24_13745 [Luteolibacter sp. SL250]|uniref:hypothetical protein n=1 Tax=Luteolibacter sp. SL250 TaxID=2995170 RepID=UPI0022707CF8|nr:hypothetical protein [Luteolibacter sp. SL250]WAC18298.1 hypothetical protein OVA24_13745 [Luteolibacter sp. SL250]